MDCSLVQQWGIRFRTAKSIRADKCAEECGSSRAQIQQSGKPKLCPILQMDDRNESIEFVRPPLFSALGISLFFSPAGYYVFLFLQPSHCHLTFSTRFAFISLQSTARISQLPPRNAPPPLRQQLLAPVPDCSRVASPSLATELFPVRRQEKTCLSDMRPRFHDQWSPCAPSPRTHRRAQPQVSLSGVRNTVLQAGQPPAAVSVPPIRSFSRPPPLSSSVPPPVPVLSPFIQLPHPPLPGIETELKLCNTRSDRPCRRSLFPQQPFSRPPRHLRPLFSGQHPTAPRTCHPPSPRLASSACLCVPHVPGLPFQWRVQSIPYSPGKRLPHVIPAHPKRSCASTTFPDTTKLP